MAQDLTQTARALKAVVIILGVLIVVGATVLAVEIFRRVGQMADERPLEAFATATVSLPAGARVIDIAGGGDAVSLLVERADGRRQLITVDRRSGTVIGTLTFEPER
ncbi:MAG: hypothetical protein IIA00_07305 [Proteobacteria bacterium]|nr:hypothetical protein [Pseudomonadota bacterium]